MKLIHKIGGKLYVNPDGLEWKRSKWIKPIQVYLKYSEKKMAENADLIISDNQGIEDYLKAEYDHVTSKVIAYGTNDVVMAPGVAQPWLDKYGIQVGAYYLVVGRFVPENNYEVIIRNFMNSSTTHDLVIITNHLGDPYFEKLRQLTNFDQDKRIKFVGTVYDKEQLTAIRKHAFAYIHGHAVGGTNPGLLEAMSVTDLNLVFDVSFNRNVALDSALFWQIDTLTEVMSQAEMLKVEAIEGLAKKAKKITIIILFAQVFLFLIFIDLFCMNKQSIYKNTNKNPSTFVNGFSGAGGGGRTRTVSLPTDFESVTSANSITPANQLFYYISIFCKNQEKYYNFVIFP